VIKILKPVKKKKIRREIKILQVGLVLLTAHMWCSVVPNSYMGLTNPTLAAGPSIVCSAI
jgi:hypothetical protein